MNEISEVLFAHKQSAHCESGVVSNLLSQKGLNISEAMVFGLAKGLFFGYFPFVRINNLPLVTYRSAAGQIIKQFKKVPGITVYQKTYRDQELAMAELDAALENQIAVGLQTGVFWLPYFPQALRFHFNAHNLVVYGRQGDEYLISDPVFPEPVRCLAEDLKKARFASGALAPKGKMYYLKCVPDNFDCKPYIRRSIDSACHTMLGIPFPLIGIKGMRFLAGRLKKWQFRLGHEKAALHLGHVVRMQEEIGTGGGGFRFMYGAFLQESAEKLQDERLWELSRSLTIAGDEWRKFAVMAARICKGRAQPDDTYPALAKQVFSCATLEEQIFRDLRTWANQ